MKKIKVKADLSIISNHHQISLNNNGNDLIINIIGKSVFFIPFKQLVYGFKQRNKLKYLDQRIIVSFNSRDLLIVENSKLSIKSYSNILKIMFKSIFSTK